MDIMLPQVAPMLQFLDQMGFAMIIQQEGYTEFQRMICETAPVLCLLPRFANFEYNIWGEVLEWAVDTTSVMGTEILITLFLHINQQVLREGFNQYSYGAEENLRRYGSEVSPSYPFEDLNVPVAVIFSSDDAFITERDREVMLDMFGDNVVFSQIYPVVHSWLCVSPPEQQDMIYEDIFEILSEHQATT